MNEKKGYNQTIITNSVAETDEFAIDFTKWLVLNKKSSSKNVICLRGNLGAGKTTFVKAFTHGLGVDSSIVKSPTYTYFRRYSVGDMYIYHFDYYRLEHLYNHDIEEFLEILNNDNVFILIEWPDRLEQHLPDNRYEVQLDVIDKNKRKIVINEI